MVKRLLSGLVVIASLAGIASPAQAEPVEYVRICDAFGAGFYYLPGTDACYDPVRRETRQETEVGPWRIQGIDQPGDWVPTPWADCLLGRLVWVGRFDSEDFSYDENGSMPQTDLVLLNLYSREYVSKVLIQGGLGLLKYPFCLSFYDEDQGLRDDLGCALTEGFADQRATWSFTPRRTVPPASFSRPYHLRGFIATNGIGYYETPLPEFEGKLSAWVCVQRAL